MKFRTTTELPSKRLVLQPQSRLLLLGSCFAEHIGQKMLDGHMRAMVNPMGVLYNPESIRRCIEVLTNGTYDERYLFEDASGMWHSWLHSGKFDAVSREEALTGIKASLDDGMTWKEANQVLLDEDEGWGYSCLTMVDPETVGILYESSVAHMTFQTVPLKDIVKELK